MKFGLNMLLWTDDVREEHYPILAQLKEMGYDGVEVPLFHFDTDKAAQLGRHLDELGLERTAVTVRTTEDNPIDADAAVRQRGIDNNRRVLDCCQALGATVLVGPYHSALGHFTGEGANSDEWKRGVESMRAVAEHAQACNVMLGLEYLNRFECYLLNTAADAVRFVREVDHPFCRTMYDTFHANIEEKSPAEAIRTCSPYMVHVHISENDRSTPGSGQVAWQETFDTLAEVGYDGWFMIEAFGLALPALAAATKIWRKMYPSEQQLAQDGLRFMKDEWAKRK
jgi:D-psicose/D-tagatose/L-ribulose 3-epimerase